VLDTVKISFNLVCTVKRDAERRWVASCPKLEVVSQGKTEEQAKASLKEAIELWIESCFERHTLEEALRECGFHKVSTEEAARAREVIVIEPRRLSDDASIGTFNLDVTIPAYQAAAALAHV
jgi:predicted RNase H-like HicB family nuclease